MSRILNKLEAHNRRLSAKIVFASGELKERNQKKQKFGFFDAKAIRPRDVHNVKNVFIDHIRGSL